MSENPSRNLFRVAAGFNVLAGLPFLLALHPMAALLGLEITATSTLFIQITMGVVVGFGWAYWMISTDPVRYRPYVVLGLILKVMIVSVIFGHWLLGDISWRFPALASGDIFFGALFLLHLQRTRGR